MPVRHVLPNLRLARVASGKTQRQLAQDAAISRVRLVYCEQGVPVTTREAERIATALGVAVSLLTGEAALINGAIVAPPRRRRAS